jgi:2-dehydro-3-deoxyphosphogalactonate aldolase
MATQDAAFALVDWGSTSLRVYVTDGYSRPRLVHEDAAGGALDVPAGGFEAALDSAIGAHAPPNAPAVLCGMVGSNRGWVEVPYARAPASLADLVAGAAVFTTSRGRRVAIVPGVSVGLNGNAQPDVMRGEETQIFGDEVGDEGGEDTAVGAGSAAERVYCLPGTHSKWAIVRGSRIETLQTAMTGELFALLSKHGILAGSIAPPAGAAGEAEEEAAFCEGLASPMPLHALFSVRSRDLFAGGGEERARVRAANRGFLSGALIALELREAGEWLRRAGVLAPSAGAAVTVRVVGAGPLAERYAHALSRAAWARPEVSEPDAAARGLVRVAHRFGPRLVAGAEAFSGSAPTPSLPCSESAAAAHARRAARLASALRAAPIVAILRGLAPRDAAATGLALHAAGVRVIEVPLNSPERPLDSVRALAAALAHLPDPPLVGAGTVLTAEEAAAVADAGGEIALAPNVDAAVIRAARARGLVVYPGAATATEAFSALAAGASGLKLFPCTAISTATVAALRAVLPPATSLLAVGGVGAANGAAYLSAGCVGLGVGSAVFEPGDSPEAVGDKARKLLQALRGDGSEAWAQLSRC